MREHGVRIGLLALVVACGSSCVTPWSESRKRSRAVPLCFRTVEPDWNDRHSADPSPVRPYRNYFGVESVGPLAHHFQVWVRSPELSGMLLRVERDPRGQLNLVPEIAQWREAVPVRGASAVPADAEILALQRAVEQSLQSQCDAEDWHVEYAGRFRLLRALEVISYERTPGLRFLSWMEWSTFRTDAALTELVGPLERNNGYNDFSLDSAHWVPFVPPPGINGRRLLLAREHPPAALVEKVLQAARAMSEGQPSPSLESLVPQDAAIIPEGFVQSIVAKVALTGRSIGEGLPAREAQAKLVLILRDALLTEGTSREVEVVLGARRIKVGASLAPNKRLRAPRAMRPDEQVYRGTLSIHIEDDRGEVWDRSYSVKGEYFTDGHTVAMELGPSLTALGYPPEKDPALYFALPGDQDFKAIELVVSTDLLDDPSDGLDRP